MPLSSLPLEVGQDHESLAKVLDSLLKVCLHGEDALAYVWVRRRDRSVLGGVVALEEKFDKENAEVAEFVEDRRCWVG